MHFALILSLTTINLLPNDGKFGCKNMTDHRGNTKLKQSIKIIKYVQLIIIIVIILVSSGISIMML